jgi:hypothetical protein
MLLYIIGWVNFTTYNIVSSTKYNIYIKRVCCRRVDAHIIDNYNIYPSLYLQRQPAEIIYQVPYHLLLHYLLRSSCIPVVPYFNANKVFGYHLECDIVSHSKK